VTSGWNSSTNTDQNKSRLFSICLWSCLQATGLERDQGRFRNHTIQSCGYCNFQPAQNQTSCSHPSPYIYVPWFCILFAVVPPRHKQGLWGFPPVSDICLTLHLPGIPLNCARMWNTQHLQGALGLRQRALPSCPSHTNIDHAGSQATWSKWASFRYLALMLPPIFLWP